MRKPPDQLSFRIFRPRLQLHLIEEVVRRPFVNLATRFRVFPLSPFAIVGEGIKILCRGVCSPGSIGVVSIPFFNGISPVSVVDRHF